MDYEKAYKEAVEKLRYKISDNDGNIDYNEVVNVDELQDIFHELQENEDEKNIKDLIDELKCSLRAANCQNEACNGGHEKRIALLEWAIDWVEKQGQKKSADKVEPKFEIEKGKWYVCNTSRYTDFVKGKAYYCPKNGMLKPNEKEIARYVARDCFHPWTIEDAKDGDVLVGSYGTFIFMSKSDGYCGVLSDNTFIRSTGNNEWTEGLHPATKEQRDLFFQKMKEEGWEWVAEKKQSVSLKFKATE